ncbi:MAG: FGGY-family carbohydrate kinase [Caldilineaceae bacterium]
MAQEQIGQEDLFAITGSAVQPIFTLCKLLWLRDNEPAVLARTKRWLNMADYIAYRLCGVPAADLSLASRTLCLDLHRRQWATELIAAVGIDPAIFAPLQRNGTSLGSVLPDVAQATGLPTSAQVAVGGHDHIVGALALGVTAVGDMLNSIGTAEAIFLPVDQPVSDSNFGRQGYSQGVNATGNYYLLGGLYTSGACVDWFRETCGGGAEYAALMVAAERVAAGSLGAFFIPHLRLANSPNVDLHARGAFIGLHTDMKQGTLFRALVEGLAYEVRYSLEPMLHYMKLPKLHKVYVAGGGAYNDLYTRIKASILNHPLTVVSVKESTALGAAVLGGVGAGVYPDLPTALAQLRFAQETIEPVAADATFYDAAYQAVYQHLYQALSPLHQATARLTQ